MPIRNGNALRESANPGKVAERSLHRGRSLNIANLPNDIREQLNLRLSEGETGEPLGVGAGGMSWKGARELAAWLNALPEVQSILGAQFNGTPVSEVNLTHWRQGGYLQWLTERECFDSARALAEGDGDLASTGLSAERLLNVLTVRFGQLLMHWDTSTDENISESMAFAQIAKKARILQGISRSVLAIHRLQSQSALKKSESAASGSQTNHGHAEATKHGAEQRASGLCHAEAAQPPGGPCRAEAAQPPGGPCRAEAAQRVGGPANRKELPRNETILSPASRSAFPEILSGSITPSNLSHTPFKSDHDHLDEILRAV